MNEFISNALLLNENELAALMTGLGVKRFTGFLFSKRAMSFEENIRGINSLVRKKVLLRSGDKLRICPEYEAQLKCIAKAGRVIIIKNINAVIYCGKPIVMLRRNSINDGITAVSEMTASSLSALLCDEGLLPKKDEAEMFTRELPDEDGAKQMLSGDDGLCFKCAGDDEALLAAGRYGLCNIIAYKTDEGVKTCIYSRAAFEKLIKGILEGQ